MSTDKDNSNRFVAFAFAASDLLIEIDTSSKIKFAAGQVQSLTGLTPQDVTGKDWLDIFCEDSHANLRALIKGVKKAGRIGPLMVSICNAKKSQEHKALIVGMTIQDSTSIYLALNSNQAFFDFLAVGDYQEDTRLLSEKQFESAAIKAFQSAKSKGKDLDITFLEMDKIEEYKETLSFEDANNFTEKLQSILKEQSFEGNTASQVDNNKYAIIHDAETTTDFIEVKIQALLKKFSGDEQNLGIKSKTVDATLDKLNEREARRALIYTINQLEEEGLDAVGENLSGGFDDYLHKNAGKISRLRNLIGQQAFTLHYQPIVYLADESIAHYEALVRFSGNDSPYELITFGEDIGMAADIDIAILKQAVGFINKKSKVEPSLKIAVNISGQSIQSERFFKSMIGILETEHVSPDNMLFEITESTAIGDLEQVNRYIQEIRKRKFEVCLDDFGAGAASFQYLNALDIDCVKIDGKYIGDALNSSRDEAMVRNLARMCQDLGVTTVAEMVETQEQMDYLVDIGIDKAQGWLFGKAAPKAEYTKRVR
ncbi:MAG: EAL domain-containing protein [Alphaproteobacteria bacterium]|nr:EAL domain-containing protein [Alphaproteobacteria bacterium]